MAAGLRAAVQQSVAMNSQSVPIIGVQCHRPKGVMAIAPTMPVQKKLTEAASRRET